MNWTLRGLFRVLLADAFCICSRVSFTRYGLRRTCSQTEWCHGKDVCVLLNMALSTASDQQQAAYAIRQDMQ